MPLQDVRVLVQELPIELVERSPGSCGYHPSGIGGTLRFLRPSLSNVRSALARGSELGETTLGGCVVTKTSALDPSELAAAFEPRSANAGCMACCAAPSSGPPSLRSAANATLGGADWTTAGSETLG
jgi:hypothetical protein